MKLFHYEHCPYCIRVRMLVNFKNMAIEDTVFLDDDEESPISMIGQKMLPILQKEDGSFLAESLDIIDHLDQLDTSILPAHYTPETIDNWLKRAKPYLRKLTYPRMIEAPYFKEFETQSSRDYFEYKKSKLAGNFAECIANTAALKTEFTPIFAELSDIVLEMTNDALAWEDIHLFPYVLSLTLVPELEWPNAVKTYFDKKSTLFDLPAYSPR